MSSSPSQPTPEQIQLLEAHATLALHALTSGKLPEEAHISPLTGELRQCVNALVDALRSGGLEAVKNVFKAFQLAYPYIGTLASRQSPVFNADGTLATTPPESEQPKERRIRFLPLSEFLHRPSQQWLITGVLPRDGLALVYGEPGGFKSFLVMGWSLCMATGTPWVGHSVAHGPVAYIVAEGGNGIGKRAQAWLVHHERYFRSDQELDQQVPLRLYDKSIVLQDHACVSELLTALQEDFPEEPPIMVVIDTLSRCTPGVEEASNTDMALVLASADRLREQFHCTVTIVHHEGKDKERGPRGASALLANIETAILVTPAGGVTRVTCEKAKDAPPFDKILLERKEIRFGPQPDDASLVLVRGDEALQEEATPTRPAAQLLILTCLADKQMTHEDLKQACMNLGQNENTFKSAFKKLNSQRVLVKIDKLWQVNQSTQEETGLQEPEKPEQEDRDLLEL